MAQHKLLLEIPDKIETERLLLRPYQAGDGAAYYQLALNNRDHLLPFEKGNPALNIKTLEDAEILVRQFGVDWAARSIFFAGGWEKTTQALVVQIVLMVVNWELPEFEIGYFVDKDHQGQGFVTEGARAMLRLAFECLGARRVSAGCSDANVRSQRVLERCGMVREGHIRQNKLHITHADGTPGGDYLYGMLRAEFENLAGK